MADGSDSVELAKLKTYWPAPASYRMVLPESALLVDVASSIPLAGSELLSSLVPTVGARPGTGLPAQSVMRTLTGMVEPAFQTLVPSLLNGESSAPIV